MIFFLAELQPFLLEFFFLLERFQVLLDKQNYWRQIQLRKGEQIIWLQCVLLTSSSLEGTELRNIRLVTSIASSGKSIRNLNPISAKADKSATWSPWRKKSNLIIQHLYPKHIKYILKKKKKRKKKKSSTTLKPL